MSPIPDPPGRPAPLAATLREDSPFPQPPVRVVVEHGGALGRWGNRLAWVGLAICIFVIIGLVTSYQSYFQTDPGINEKYHSLSKTATDKIAIITIDGTIMHTEGFAKWQIDRVAEDDNVKAIVLRVDSPGGTVTGSHYIYHHLKKLKREKEVPLVVSMGGIAASGGYYVAMAVEDTPKSIFAEDTTWTGSIGVLIPHYDLSGLLEKLQVQDDSIVSHPLKQIGSLTKKMTPEERTILQNLVNESFQDFKDIVHSGRPNMKPQTLNEVATGQIFTAKQAKKYGLVDELGFIEEAIDRAIELAGLERTSVRVIKYQRPAGVFDSLMGSPLGKSGELDPKDIVNLTTPRAYYLWSSLPGLTAAADER